MTESEINQRIFAGARSNEPRGFSDAFTFAEVVALANGPEYRFYSQGMKDWIWSYIDENF